MAERRPQEDRPAHYGCHEFREDAERVIGGRAEQALAALYKDHLTRCRDCRGYHGRLEAIYRRTPDLVRLDTFARDREFEGILGRTRAEGGDRAPRSFSFLGVGGVGGVGAVGLLSAVAALLALALMVPSVGELLFAPPRAVTLELDHEGELPNFDNTRIPDRALSHHMAQSFGRVIGGQAVLTDEEGRTTAGDSLQVGARIDTEEIPVQVTLAGRLIANFEPHSVAVWNRSDAGRIEIALLSGSLAIRYDRLPGDPILRVVTPTALVEVVGTVFTVAVDDARATTVSVLRGKVEVLHLDGRSLAEVEAGFRFDTHDSSYRDVGRDEVAAALPLSERHVLAEGDAAIEGGWEAGQVPRAWTVPGLSDNPSERTIDRVRDPDPRPVPAPLVASARRDEVETRGPADEGKAATRELINGYKSHRAKVAAELERCRDLQVEPDTRFRAARCLGDFMSTYGSEPEAVEGLILLGTLRMDFAHDYQSATRNFEEFLRRAPDHPKAELARYRIVLAAIEGGYIDRGVQTARVYLHMHPDGHYVGRILQRFPELKSEI